MYFWSSGPFQDAGLQKIYMVGQSTSIYYIVVSLQLKMYCLNIINPIAMGTGWTMVLMMPLIMMMAISTNRSLAWLFCWLSKFRLLPSQTPTKYILSKSYEKFISSRFNTSFQLTHLSNFSKQHFLEEIPHTLLVQMKGLGFRSTLQGVGSMAARTIPRNEVSKQCVEPYPWERPCFFLEKAVHVMCIFELIRYELWIWNIYGSIHEGYLGLGVSKNKKHDQSHTNSTYFLFNRPCLSSWTGPPPEVTLRPFELTTSEKP